MAGTVQILLKVGADPTEAIRALKAVGIEAEVTSSKVANIGSSFAAGLRAAASRGGAGAGSVVAALAGGSGLGGALLAGITAAAPEIGIPLDVAAGGLSLLGNVDSKARAAAQARLNQPTSVADAVKNLRDLAKKRADALTPGNIFGDIKSFFGGRTPGEIEAKDIADQQATLFRQIARDNPTLAAQMIAMMGSPKALTKILAEETAKQARATQSTAFLSTLPGATHITVNQGVGDPNATGRAIRAAIDIRDRNNGQYVTTLSRR